VQRSAHGVSLLFFSFRAFLSPPLRPQFHLPPLQLGRGLAKPRMTSHNSRVFICLRRFFGSKQLEFRLFLAASCLVLAGCARRASAPSPTPSGAPGYTLVWSDEFNGKNGSLPDPAKWTYDIGGNGWGNQELEYYTNRGQNVQMQNGNLVITALPETYAGADGVIRNYTSARLKTQGLFSQAYGRFEARIKLPAGQGIWPAFWLLGDDIARVGWPQCGEIDIMENIGKEPATNHGSLHGPSSTKPTADLTGTFTLGAITNLPPTPSPIPGAERLPRPMEQRTIPLSDEFHLYAIDWQPEQVRFYLDSELYASFTSAQWPAGGTWVFDHPFFIILNVAVGGNWPGPPDSTTNFPQKMFVDYVRVYRKDNPAK
jgi:beta-glucanase (GH16 family)